MSTIIHIEQPEVKFADVNLGTYIDFDVENDKDLKFKVSDHVRMSKYENIFAKC